MDGRYMNILFLLRKRRESDQTIWKGLWMGVLLIHIYEKGFKDFEIAYAAALGIILLIIVLLCTLAGFGLIKKLKLDYQSFD